MKFNCTICNKQKKHKKMKQCGVCCCFVCQQCVGPYFNHVNSCIFCIKINMLKRLNLQIGSILTNLKNMKKL